jgi:hypothetical protein
MNDKQSPTLRVYSVIPRDGKDDYWLNLGLAFPHSDGKGFNVVLQAYPLDGKLVLREITEEDNERPPRRDDRDANDDRTRAAIRQTNDRRRDRGRDRS